MTYYPSFLHLRLVFFLLFLFGTAFGCQDTPSIDSQSTTTHTYQKLAVHTLKASSPSFSPEEIKEKETKAWHLFDRSTSQTFSPNLEEGDEILLTISFDDEVRLSALKVYQSPLFVLTLEDKTGRALEGISEIDLSSFPQKDAFSILSLKTPLKTDSVRLRLTALSENATLPELEFWGDTLHNSYASPQKTNNNSLSSEFHSVSAIPDKFILAKKETVNPTDKPSKTLLEDAEESQTGVSCREVLFFLEQDPNQFKYAYLSYDTDVFRPWVLRKSLNGSLFSGGHEPLPTTDSLQAFAEVLDLSRLSLGKNTLTVCLPKGFLGQVRLENLSLLFEKDTGQDTIEEVSLQTPEGKTQALKGVLLDKDQSTLAQISLEDTLTADLERFLSIDTLQFSLHTPSSIQSVICLALDEGKTELLSDTQIGQTLFSGENFLTISKKSACRSLHIQFQKDTSLQEISVSGSGVKEPIDWPKLQIISPLEHFGDTAILQGFALAPSQAKGPIRISIDGTPLTSVSGVFDEVLTRSENLEKSWTVLLEATFPDGSEFSQEIVLSKDASVEKERLLSKEEEHTFSAPSPLAKKYGKVGESVVESISPGKENHIKLGTDVSLKIPENTQAQLQGANAGLGALPPVSITHLNQPSVPKMSPWLINVTAPAGHAYEFLPHGIEFSEAVEVSVPFDPSLLPDGASVDDIKTYYYDDTTQKWEPLEQVGINATTQSIQSETTHFTIMANGVLAMPETPSLSSVSPNSLSSLSAANPLANIDLIAPPSANNSGDANVSFPIWSPSGRGNYSPSAGLQYSSNAGNGFLGLGWNLPLSKIEIDTRFGVPTYEDGEEVRYLLDGEALVPAAAEPNAPTCTTGNTKRYRPRVEGAFLYILRCGSSPINNETNTNSYRWELYDRQGTQYIYGGSTPSRLISYFHAGIFSWHIETVTDVSGNQTNFLYDTDQKSLSPLSGEDFRQKYPQRIEYTSHTDGTPATYRIDFLWDNDDRNDITSTGRPGFKVLTRKLLRAIQVSFLPTPTSSELLREYVLQYRVGQFEKTLLENIVVFGKGGCLSSLSQEQNVYAPLDEQSCPLSNRFFYEHRFEYFNEVEDVGFTAPEEWSLLANEEQKSSAFTQAQGFSANLHAYFGLAVGFPIKLFSAGVRGGLSGNTRNETTGLYDINGDGLPDQIFVAYDEVGTPAFSVLYNQFSKEVLPEEAKRFSPDIPPGDSASSLLLDTTHLDSLGRDISGSLNGDLEMYFALPSRSISGFLSGSLGKRFMLDVNGDGLIDQMQPTQVLLSSREDTPGNPQIDTLQFAPATFVSQTAVDLSSDPSFQLDTDLDEKLFLGDAIRKWVAPFDGKVLVNGYAKKLRPGGEDGVEVALYHHRNQENDTFLRALEPPFFLGPDDTTAMPFFQAQNLGAIEVKAGDALYLRVGTFGDTPFENGELSDEVETQLSIDYLEYCGLDGLCHPVTLEEEDMREPNGAKVFSFDSVEDFRVAGNPTAPFSVPVDGIISIDSSFFKYPTADHVRACIQKIQRKNSFGQPIAEATPNIPCDANLPFDSGAQNPTFYQKVLPGMTVLGVNEFGQGGMISPSEETVQISVKAGDLLVFRVESDFSIDPSQIEWDVTGTYAEINDQGLFRTPTAHESALLQFTFPVSFPLPHYPQKEPKYALFTPEDGTLTVDSAVVLDFGSSSEAILAIRAAQVLNGQFVKGRLLYKDYVGASQTLPTLSFPIFKGEWISFEILQKEQPATLHWNVDQVTLEDSSGFTFFDGPRPVLEGYRPAQFPLLEGGENTEGAVDLFSGGYHQWRYGVWNGKHAFDPTPMFFLNYFTIHNILSNDTSPLEDWIQFGPNPSSSLSQDLDFLFTHLIAMRPVPQPSSYVQGPSWVGMDESMFVTATSMHGAKLGTLIPNTHASFFPGQETHINLSEVFQPKGVARVSNTTGHAHAIGFKLPAKLSLGTTPSVEANAGISNTRSQVDAFDIDGDSIVDVVTKDGWIKGYLDGTEHTELTPWQGLALESLRHRFSTQFSRSLGLHAPQPKTSSSGRPTANQNNMPVEGGSGKDNSLPSGNVGTGLSISRSRQREDFVDINGDGLLDRVRRNPIPTPEQGGPQDGTAGMVMVQLNLGGRFGEEEVYGGQSWAPDTVDAFFSDQDSVLDLGEPQNSPDYLSHETTISQNFNVGFAPASAAFGLHLGFQSTSTHTTVDLRDINGDGLPDLLFKKSDNGRILVQYNQGNGFSPPSYWDTPDWGQPMPETIVPASLGGILQGTNPADLGLTGPDVLSGTGHYSLLQPFGVEAGLYLSINIPIFIGLNLILNPGLTAGIDFDSYELALFDITGDGYVDHVLRRTGHDELGEPPSTFFVKQNRLSGKANLLKIVRRPLGGKIELDYERSPNTVEMPSSKMLLTSVTLDDGVDLSQGTDFVSPDLLSTYTYENGYFDRQEKEFFGFETVKSTRPDGLTVTQVFDNNTSYTRKGLLLSETVSLGASLFEQTVHTYGEQVLLSDNPSSLCSLKAKQALLPQTACDVVFPFVTNTTTTIYETGEQKVKESIPGTYDSYGNLLHSLEKPDIDNPSDDVYVSVTYQNDISNWILGLPTEIQVHQGSAQGTLLRHREGSYDSLGRLIDLRTHTGSSINPGGELLVGESRTTFNYTEYGMLESVLFPIPQQGEERKHLSYEYDDSTKQYPITVTDLGFSLSSSTSYDLGFGLPLVATAANQNSLTRTYDNFGRLVSVRGPYDTTSAPALEMTYHLSSSEIYPYAKTMHQPHTASGQSIGTPLETITVVDGFGRVLELSKTAVVDGDLGMTVQGPASLDTLGREIESYQPFFINGLTGGLLPTGGTLQVSPSTELLYDTRDRITRVTHPDSSLEQTSYRLQSIPNSGSSIVQLKVSQMDPEGNLKEIYQDTKGQLLSLLEYPKENELSQTFYQYSPLGELLSITDPGNNVSTFTYDMQGLQTSIDNPDTGLHTLHYDLAGNLIERVEPNHVQGGFQHGIQYTYDRGRLLQIDYPAKPSVVYEYGLHTTPLGERGRLLFVEDETGQQQYTYGNMGEILETVRTVTFQGDPTQADITFHTKGEFDSFGRQLSLTYPDGEKVDYSYDASGNLRSVVGLQTYVSNMEYNAFGQKTKVVYGNGLESTFSYDDEMRRLASKQTSHQSTGIQLQNLSYEYDQTGNPTQVTSLFQTPPPAGEGRPGPGGITYEYDGGNRLVSAVGDHTLSSDEETSYSQTFTYDTLHNLTHKTRIHRKEIGGVESFPEDTNIDLSYVYGGPRPHAPTQVGDTNISYDASGHITQLHNTQTGELKDLIWDDDGRLIQSETQLGMVRNYYDGTGLRVLKRSEQGGDTVFVNSYFDLKLVSGNDPLGTKHIYADGMRVCSTFQGEYDVQSTGNTPPQDPGKSYYFLGDHLGSSNLLTRDDGTVHEHYEYFPDGEIWIEQKPNIEIENGYLFTGKFLDEETSFYDFGQRFYDPKTGIWLSTDPLFSDTPGEAIGRPMVMSLYTYGAQNPIKFIDPDGRDVIPYHQGSGTDHVPPSDIAIMSRLGLCKNFCVTYQKQFGIDGPSEAEMLLDTVILIDEVSIVFGIPGLAKGLLKAGGKRALKRFLRKRARQKNAPAPAPKPKTGTNKQKTNIRAGTDGSGGGGKSKVSTSKKRKAIPKKVKDQVKAENAAKNNGKIRCEHCDVETIEPTREMFVGPNKPERLPDNLRNFDHKIPRSRGGKDTAENLQILCQGCNSKKSNKFIDP